MRKMLGSDEKFSWDAMAKNNAIEKLAGQYFDEALMSDDQKAERDRMARQDAENQKNSKNAADKMNSVDDAIAGIFLSIRNDITGTIQDAGHVADDIGAGLKYAANKVGDFGQSIKNGIVNGHFVTNEEMNNIRVERYSELLKNPVVMAGMGGVEAMGWQLATQRAEEMAKLEQELGVSPENAEWLAAKREMEKEGSNQINETVESTFIKGTNLDKYTGRVAKYYNTDDNPLSKEDVLNKLCEVNNCTPEELQDRMNKGLPIKEPVEMSWNSDIQTPYDKEKAARLAEQKMMQEMQSGLNAYDNQIGNIQNMMDANAAIINAYNNRMRDTQGGEKLAGFFGVDSEGATMFVANNAKKMFDALSYSSINPETTAGKIGWAAGATVGLPVLSGLTAIGLFTGGAIDAFVGVPSYLFAPYKGQSDAENAAGRWNFLNDYKKNKIQERDAFRKNYEYRKK